MHVMQILIETQFLFQRICLAQDTDYAAVLNQLLFARHVSLSIKASICRQIITCAQQGDAGAADNKRLKITKGFVRHILPSLVQVMENPQNTFLQALATAAVDNLAHRYDYIKSMLFKDVLQGNTAHDRMHDPEEEEHHHAEHKKTSIISVLYQNLASRIDDDLCEYTLDLLVALTKLAHLRKIIFKHKALLRSFFQLLSGFYSKPLHYRKLLVPLCSVLGQLCNDDELRVYIAEVYGIACIECLLYIYMAGAYAKPYSVVTDSGIEQVLRHELPVEQAILYVPLRSKVLFCMKQLAVNNPKVKTDIGPRVLSPVTEELFQAFDVFLKAVYFKEQKQHDSVDAYLEGNPCLSRFSSEKNNDGLESPVGGGIFAQATGIGSTAIDPEKERQKQELYEKHCAHVEFWAEQENFALCIDFLSNSMMLLTLLLVDQSNLKLLHEMWHEEFRVFFSRNCPRAYEVVHEKIGILKGRIFRNTDGGGGDD